VESAARPDCGAIAASRRAGSARWTRCGATALRSRSVTRGLHRVLGIGRDRRLALAHGDARPRRLRRRTAEPGCSQARSRVGSSQGRGQPGAMQSVRCRGDHARAGAPAHHMAGRSHAQDGNGRRHAGLPSTPLRPGKTRLHRALASLHGRATPSRSGRVSFEAPARPTSCRSVSTLAKARAAARSRS
jgi:hypothetical protein